MIPVNQTILGNVGNCLQASVASIFEKKLSELPHFVDMDGDRNPDSFWFEQLDAYCRAHLNCFAFRRYGKIPYTNHYYIAVVHYFKVDLYHAIVGKNGKMVHNPSGKPDDPQNYRLKYYIGFGKL